MGRNVKLSFTNRKTTEREIFQRNDFGRWKDYEIDREI